MRLVAGVFVVFVIGCSNSEPEVCKVVCAADVDCPSGQTCGPLGRCTAGQLCPCEANELLGCIDDGATSLSCNATSDGVTSESCTFGCNDASKQCNACAPSTSSCSNDALETCGDDGVIASSVTCSLSCVDGTATRPAHCGYVAPRFLPDVCDEVASAEEIVFGSAVTFDTGLDTSCTGGIIVQASGPEICVVRAKRIAVTASLRAIGSRALALVADDSLEITAPLDASGRGGTRGAGGYATSGTRAGANTGGGGAGFSVAGAAGGMDGVGDGSPGGSVLVLSDVFQGGPGAQGPTNNQSTQGYPAGAGGGGGGLMLVACRGAATISSNVLVNGGGGGGGKMVIFAGQTTYVGGAGGGAGGVILIEALRANVTGNLYANGGGGGAGCGLVNCTGGVGQDGQTSTTPATGGLPDPNGGNGGAGGTTTMPTAGQGVPSGLGSGGGGGASAGYLILLTPRTEDVVAAPAQTSPVLDRGTATIR
ncbi:hypothetical protein BH11MYX2_BH11MYX2_07380 [soil metagenome]